MGLSAPYVPSLPSIFTLSSSQVSDQIIVVQTIKMQFFKLFSVALALPAMVIASPAPGAAPVTEGDLSLLLERQSSLTDLLSTLTESLKGIQELLSPTSLTNINEVVTDLSTLFKAPTTNQTKSLINTASSLLGGSAISGLIDDLPTLLGSVSGLLTPALITNLTDILGNAHDLLTPSFVSETKGLISDVAPVSLLMIAQYQDW
jgi:hypothetical protein